jgi:hypothetical protein
MTVCLAALFTGEVSGRRAGIEKDLVLLTNDTINRQRDGGTRHIDKGIHSALVAPLPGDGGTHIRLVLMIRDDDFDFI